jgi:RNase H-fold protein (predicted Holliday junction resolvase)
MLAGASPEVTAELGVNAHEAHLEEIGNRLQKQLRWDDSNHALTNEAVSIVYTDDRLSVDAADSQCSVRSGKELKRLIL